MKVAHGLGEAIYRCAQYKRPMESGFCPKKATFCDFQGWVIRDTRPLLCFPGPHAPEKPAQRGHAPGAPWRGQMDGLDGTGRTASCTPTWSCRCRGLSERSRHGCVPMIQPARATTEASPGFASQTVRDKICLLSLYFRGPGERREHGKPDKYKNSKWDKGDAETAQLCEMQMRLIEG